MDDIIRCYADVMYLKTTLHLPPQPVDGPSEQLVESTPQPAPHGNVAPHGILSTARRLLALARRHMDRQATAAPLAGKRSFRRIGG